VDYYRDQELIDLTGIASRFEARLNSYGIMTTLQFLEASEYMLKKQVFKSIVGTYWYKRLRGYEIDDFDTSLGMVGRQWVVREPTKNAHSLVSCLSFLCETTGMKLRYREVEARGICVWATYQNGEFWQQKRMHKTTYYTNQEVYRRALELFNQRPAGTVRTIGIYCYMLSPSQRSQLSMFENIERVDWLAKAVDEINDMYGTFSVYMASSLEGTKLVKQKIPFGGTEYFELLLSRA
jgi:DNA polymerase-4